MRFLLFYRIQLKSYSCNVTVKHFSWRLIWTWSVLMPWIKRIVKDRQFWLLPSCRGKSKESTTNWLRCKFTLKIMPEVQEVVRKSWTPLEFFTLSLVVDSTSSVLIVFTMESKATTKWAKNTVKNYSWLLHFMSLISRDQIMFTRS